MSDLPPNIDAILASIRSRLNDDTPAAVEAPTPVVEAVAAPVADVGAVALEGGQMTIDALIRSMLEPLLKTWLDANMPEIVERVAQDEIRRLTGRD